MALYSATNLDRFIDQAFRTLSRVVPCAYVSVFYQRAGDAFLRERDSRGRRWSGAFMQRYIALTPAIPLAAANPGLRILTTRAGMALSDAALHQTAFYREVMRRQGWRHGACLCFWTEPPGSFPIFVLTLYRTADEPDFADHELALLEGIHSFLAPAVARFHQISASNAISDGIAMALRHVSRGIVVLDWQLHVVRANLAGRRSCAEWNQPLARRSRAVLRGALSVPSCLMQACHGLRHALTSVMRQHADSGAQRRRQIAHPDVPGFMASVTVMCEAAAIAEPSFVIEFEYAERSPAPVEDTASSLMSLTKSEREVALVVSEGISNEEAAERLRKSIHAVKFLLHRIYRKLNVRNRAQLSLLLNGRQSAESRAPYR